MTETFCKDCPCLIPVKTPKRVIQACAKDAHWEGIEDPYSQFCYTGRQIMEKEATWNALKKCYPPTVSVHKEPGE